jgi:RNA polymerase sigma factor (sigma-70 family)
MDLGQDITFWLDRLKHDSATAAHVLWDGYFQQMVKIARQRLPRHAVQIADAEDVALSAFKSFCLGVQQGRFEQLVRRDSLWPLLVAITANKAKQTRRWETRKKRGGDCKREALWEDLLSKGPTPEFTVELSDQIHHLLRALDRTGDHDLRPIVLWSLEGWTTEEIAERLDCVTRTVQRKLKIVRRIWLVGGDA